MLEKKKENDRRYYKRNREKINQRRREQWSRDKEKHAAEQKVRYRKRRIVELAKIRDWMEKIRNRKPHQYEREQLAYSAGVIDGEGCISLFKMTTKEGRIRCLAPKITIANTQREILDYCKKVLGGYMTKRSDRGARKEIYFLIITGWQSIFLALAKVAPFLVGKKRRAELLMNYLEIHYTRFRRTGFTGEELKICDELHKLNKRGNSG
jgi:hypothetical protein